MKGKFVRVDDSNLHTDGGLSSSLSMISKGLTPGMFWSPGPSGLEIGNIFDWRLELDVIYAML